jgi:hypothetical protein
VVLTHVVVQLIITSQVLHVLLVVQHAHHVQDQLLTSVRCAIQEPL